MDSNELLEAILASCQDIFALMLPLQMSPRMSERPLPADLLATPPPEDVIATIGLTGLYSGTISLYLSLKMALAVAGWMMEQSYEEMNSDVFEAMGEMINMIAGGMKNRLSSAEKEVFDVSLPVVIAGLDKTVFHGKNKENVLVPIETDQGLLTVSLVLERS